MKPSLPRVATFLFFSGACALVYQVAWFRELRLIFGGSTSASSAVMAVFMAGLGIGGWRFGRRVDTAKSPLSVYAHLELAVSVFAAVSPLLVALARMVYVGLGGVGTLGIVGATVVRLLLTVIVLGPATIAMGGTMPAAARAVERAASTGRQRVGLLYGINTIGAVAGTVAANFFLLEVFGTRMTLWTACLLNALVGVIARSLARSEAPAEPEIASAPADDADETATVPSWFPPLAAGTSGLAFMLMELVWYRMLAPLLGGTTYTFGLILAVALVGIGLGGALYSRRTRASSLSLFALTCVLEALAIGLPFACGDRIAITTLLLSPLARSSFSGAVGTWTAVACFVILPAAVISGFQFPAVIGLYGRGSKNVGAHVGRAYVANTIGSILGAIAGGFGLLPLLGAVRCWQLVVVMLFVTALVALVTGVRQGWRDSRGAVVLSGAVGVAALLSIAAQGPTAAWRHSGIGAGRAGGVDGFDRKSTASFLSRWRSGTAWEEDGVESGVALYWLNGYSFIVNGKSDGGVWADRATQVMSALLGALVHGDPKTSLVVGLGTGSTAGWLGSIPTMERVDVMELEPAILRVAKDCSPVNNDVLSNPKVHIALNDAREGLLTTHARYDLVFSEPSNPYRAGISSLYTLEYYRGVAERLSDDGVFAQWIQTYDVDPFVVATAMTTLHEVFPSISVWQTTPGDLLLIGRKRARPLDFNRMRVLLATEPFETASRVAWETASLEGVLAHFVGDERFVEAVVASRAGVVNVDDQNLLEFGFARNVGRHSALDKDIGRTAHRLAYDAPEGSGDVDRELVMEEQLLFRGSGTLQELGGSNEPSAARFANLVALFEHEDWPRIVKEWTKLGRERPRSHAEAVYVARALAEVGDPRFPTVVSELKRPVDEQFLTALWHLRTQRVPEGVALLEQALVATQKDAWVDNGLLHRMLNEAQNVSTVVPPEHRKRLASLLLHPFAVERERAVRLEVGLRIASNTNDPKFCVDFIDHAGAMPIEEPVLKARASCFQDAGDPRAGAALEELGAFISFPPVFGAGMAPPTPPPATPSTSAN